MVADAELNAWFCREILPLEAALTRFIRRNWRISEDVVELRQDVYERALSGARSGLPTDAQAYMFAIARHLLINRAARARIISFELIADLENVELTDVFATERHFDARDRLRRARAGLDTLPRRCREVVVLRKVEQLTTKETAERLGVSIHTVERQLTLGMRALVDFMNGGSGKVRRTDSRLRIRLQRR